MSQALQEKYDELRRDVDRMASAFGVIRRALDSEEDPAVVSDVVAICERHACGVLDLHQDAEADAPMINIEVDKVPLERIVSTLRSCAEALDQLDKLFVVIAQQCPERSPARVLATMGHEVALDYADLADGVCGNVDDCGVAA